MGDRESPLDAREFADFLTAHPLLAEQLRELAVTSPARRGAASGAMVDGRRRLFLLPVVAYILGELGTPWERGEGCYSDVQREQFARWASPHGTPADAVELNPRQRSGERIMRFLELMESPQLRGDWDALAVLCRRMPA